MSEDEGTPALPWRVRTLEKRVDQLDAEKADADAVGELKDEVKSMRRALYTFALSVVGSAVAFALTVFELLGKAHP